MFWHRRSRSASFRTVVKKVRTYRSTKTLRKHDPVNPLPTEGGRLNRPHHHPSTCVTRPYLRHVIIIRAVVASDVGRDSKLGLHKAWLTIWGTEAVGEVVRGSPCKIPGIISSVQVCSVEFGDLPMYARCAWPRRDLESVCVGC